MRPFINWFFAVRSMRRIIYLSRIFLVGMISLLLSYFLDFSSAPAAYRVYQYVIRSAENPAIPLAYLDTSTLPPLAYQTYHGSNLVEVELLRSWPCGGDTSGRPYCAAPGDQFLAAQEEPAPPAMAPVPPSPSPGSSYEN